MLLAASANVDTSPSGKIHTAVDFVLYLFIQYGLPVALAIAIWWYITARPERHQPPQD